MGTFDVIANARKRRVFFSFHYDDIMRVNNVRKSGQFKTEQQDGRGIEGFYDYSLWESRKLDGPDALKRLIREGVQNTSAVCVLAGAKTWQRRWVRYEIARSVIDGRGLLAVHINNINSNKAPFGPDALGDNPLRYLGIARKSSDGLYYICERKYVDDAWTWKWYQDYTLSIDVPAYMPKPAQNEPYRLSQYCAEYDYSEQGHRHIGDWIDRAAQAVGR